MANYETINILFEALLDSSSDKPEDVKKTLLSKGKYMGLQYEFTIDNEGDSNKPLILHQIKAGGYKRID